MKSVGFATIELCTARAGDNPVAATMESLEDIPTLGVDTCSSTACDDAGVSTATGTTSSRKAGVLQLFRPSLSLEQEIEKLEELRKHEPQYARQLMLQNNQLITLASQGCLDGMVQLLLGCREGELLSWTCAKMFEAACSNGHVEVITFMCENGVTQSHPGIRNIFHSVIATACEDAPLLRTLPILVKKFGFNVNTMRKGDGYTPLHVACQFSRLVLFKMLILLGADISAIANDNSLPMSLAMEASIAASTSSQVVASGEIVKYLQKLGASTQVAMVSSSG